MPLWDASSRVEALVPSRREGAGHGEAGSVAAQAFKVSSAVLAGRMLSRLQGFVIFL